jgi:hypothetical protein
VPALAEARPALHFDSQLPVGPREIEPPAPIAELVLSRRRQIVGAAVQSERTFP